MEKLPSLINENAVRYEQIFSFWLALSKYTDCSYSRKIEILADEFCLGEKTVAKVIELKKKEK